MIYGTFRVYESPVDPPLQGTVERNLLYGGENFFGY